MTLTISQEALRVGLREAVDARRYRATYLATPPLSPSISRCEPEARPRLVTINSGATLRARHIFIVFFDDLFEADAIRR